METNRRDFLGWATAGLAALLGAAVAAPPLALLLGPLARRGSSGGSADYLALGPVSAFADGEPTRVTFEVTTRDGWTTRTDTPSAWVVRKGEEVTVFTATCPHLGCSVAWKAKAREFACPCHDSAFAPDGARLHGPARRGLDPLPSRIAGGRVEVRFVEFEPGLGERRATGGGTNEESGA